MTATLSIAGFLLRNSRRSTLLFSVLFTGAAVAGVLSVREKNVTDRHHAAQVAINGTEILVQDVRGMGWLMTAVGEVTPDSEDQLKQKESALETARNELRARMSERATDELFPGLENFIQSINHQLELIHSGEFHEARRVDFEEVSPQFDVLQHEIHAVSNEEAAAAHEHVSRARTEFLICLFLSALALITLFFRYHREKQVLRARNKAIRQSEIRFRALTEKSTDVILITDAAGKISYVSPSVTRVLSSLARDLMNRNLADVVHPDDVAMVKAALGTAVDDDRTIEARLQHGDGRWLDFECIVRNLLNQQDVNGLVFNLRDITERKKAEAELLFNASHDRLTGQSNRILFLARLASVLERARRHHHPAGAVLLLDVDDFKVVNDCMGHAAGDALLVELARRLNSCIREDGSVARLGGDEFTILVEDAVSPNDAMRVAQRIHTATAKPFIINGQEVHKRLSIGIAVPSPGLSAEEVLQSADIAMYRAKANGKGRTELFDRTMQEEVAKQLNLESRLQQAIKKNEFQLYYQPIVTVQTGLIEGFEALLRWQPPDSELVSADAFIPTAEQSGMIIPIGRQVLTEGCFEAAAWYSKYHDDVPLYVSLNVSARHVSHPAFIEHVSAALKRSDVRPECVKIELTESIAMSDASTTEETLTELRGLGVRLSIDDFGTGFSSLAYLRRFRFDSLKIDQSFVRGMETDPANRAIVKAVVALGRSLGLEVVAEGVETTGQLELLRAIGCHAFQGYLFSHALPGDAADALIDRNRQRSLSTL